MAISASDVRFLLTVSTGPGNTFPQPTPDSSLGGYASHTPWYGGTAGDLFSEISTSDQAAGKPDYRCIYISNANATATAPDVRVYVSSQTPSGASLSIGVDPTAVSALGSAAAQALTVADKYTAPAGVTFSTPTTYTAGLQLGDLPAGTGRAVWLLRTPDPATTVSPDDAYLTVQTGSG